MKNKFEAKLNALLFAAFTFVSSQGMAENALEAASFKIGLIYPKSGPLAPFSKSLANAVKLGLDEFRQDQPALGREVAVVVADDKSLASEAEKAAGRLIEQQKINVMIGSSSNIANQSILPLLEQSQIPTLIPRARSEELLQKSQIYSLTVTDRWQGRLLAYYAKNTLNKTKVILINDSTNPRSEALVLGFREAFERAGGAISGQADLQKDLGMPDPIASKSDLIFFAGASLSQNVLSGALDASGLDILVSDNYRLPLPQRSKGAIYAYQNFSALDPHPEVQEFVKAYEKRYNEKPDALAALAYEGVRVILHSFMLSRSVAGRSFTEILNNEALGGIYGVGQFNKERIFMRPVPFLKAEKGQTVFAGRIKPE